MITEVATETIIRKVEEKKIRALIEMTTHGLDLYGETQRDSHNIVSMTREPVLRTCIYVYALNLISFRFK